MKFSGKNVLITGSSRGIGADIARVLAGEGLKVWINYRSGAKEADEVKDEIVKKGGQAAVIGFDVSDEGAFVDAVKTIVDCDGELSYLVNNAGITVMRKKKFGSIVNIASIVGETGNAGQVNYAASKGGMIAMTKSFAIEAASSGIRYNAVTPGFIADIKKAFTSKIPMGRFGNALEVAEAVAFLLSDYASYITGEVLKVNGGMNMA